jgi:jumonji domain-containing protein 7
VRILADGTTSFVKPLDETMTMPAFLARLTGQDESHDEALYLQSQDGNIYRSEPGARGSPELATFQSVVARDVSWMKEASGGSIFAPDSVLTHAGESAEAVNLWIGNSKSTTSFHHDP